MQMFNGKVIIIVYQTHTRLSGLINFAGLYRLAVGQLIHAFGRGSGLVMQPIILCRRHLITFCTLHKVVLFL